MRRAISLVPVGLYAALALALTWPAATHPISAVVGGPRTDAADSLWTLWFAARRLAEGSLPLRVDGVLNHPDGGAFWPADPVDALLGAPLVLAIGAAATWSILAILHVTLAGLGAHRLARELGASPWVAGVLYAASPFTLSHLQNGASEAVIGTAVLPWAAVALVRLAGQPSLGRGVAAAGALALAATCHAYTGADAFLLAGGLLLAGLPTMAPGGRRWLLAAMVGGACLAAGPATLALHQSRVPDNVLGIKSDKELSTIRRTIGPTDPEVLLHPGDFRSPDFRTLSRYGEELVHCGYLGFVPILAAALSLVRRPRLGAIWLAGGAAVVLSMGPVLVADGGPVIFAGRRALPLPWLLVEPLPGFSALSLLWRLAQLGALALALLAGRAVAGRPWLAALVGGLGLAEFRFASPASALPQSLDATPQPAIVALHEAPDGAVMNFPVVGARGYLLEQTTHNKPVAGSLNFPNNNASRRIWKVAVDHTGDAPDALVAAVSAAARAEGVRYLVVHTDARAFDDSMYTDAVKALRAAMEPMAQGDGIRVYRFY